ncbi:hypothetical protein HYFRA_00013530 [Hymenoscyphus fraxineus]|uniref:Nucleolar 27S pre-rRNA processing Urb2/Npa2 C-terminal domain-containing protein n=1 Tax=Hymenoscyphus fraxineus TaxID=746836 RepID=A0A9N9Q0E3_9HELO|nr:hypothetical protein HYFRA_00013530 [Hymenoscyphus fraxineus]
MTLMASKSRAAQEQLATLEKASAPFIDQLTEAAKFIGEDLEAVGRPGKDSVETEKLSKTVSYHGREEWLLRWLLKKLQAPKDGIPRQHYKSWLILGHLLRNIPLPVAARLLIERKFTNILRQTLDEAEKRSKEVSALSTKTDDPVSEPKKSSKKRKRTPPLTEASDTSSNTLILQLQAIHGVLAFIVASAEPVVRLSEESHDLAFTAEYMKTTIRTTAEEAAIIFGLWLSLSSLMTKSSIPESQFESWISPFIQLWQARSSTENDLTLFSIHCTKPLLQLLGQKSWKEQLELVVARNIIIPARSDYTGTLEATLLNSLTKISIIQDSANAPILFDIATRSIQTNGSRRRKPQDDIWLQTAFVSFREAFPPKRHDANCKALGMMLQTAIKYKININLPVLRKAASEFALPEGRDNWELVADFLKLDGNVFLIPDPEDDLLDKLLSRITAISLEKEWEFLGDQIVLDVLIPLMDEFARARDLTGFLRHWFAQLVSFEKLRKNGSLLERFSAWEDDALQEQLSKLFEVSLTPYQITQIFDWLSSEVETNPDAVCVLLQAISGSISKEELVDEIQLRPYHIMFDNGISDKLDGRYKWRSLSIISQTLEWAVGPSIDEIGLLCTDLAKPFDSLFKERISSSIKETVGFEDLEALRCVCALWTAAETGTGLEQSLKNTMLNHLASLARTLEAFPQQLRGSESNSIKVCGVRQNTLYRGIGWGVWSLVRCVFVEYPKSLALGSEMSGDDTFEEMLQCVFWLCSVSEHPKLPELQTANEGLKWLSTNKDAFSNLWLSAMQQDVILNSPVIATMIDIMLKGHSYVDCPFVDLEALNTFSIRALLQLPLEIFSKKDRESVMTKWMSDSASFAKELEFSSADPAVLSLMIKVMNRPTFYEGMSFQNLVNLANHLTQTTSHSPKVGLSLFKQLVRLIICQMSENMEQIRNKAYITETLSDMKKMLKSLGSKKKGEDWSYSLIALFESTLGALQIKSASMGDLDIISASKFQKLNTSFKESLLTHMHIVIGKLTKKLAKESSSGKPEHLLSLHCILDALSNLGVSTSELVGLQEPANVLLQSANFMSGDELETGKKLQTFMTTHSESSNESALFSLTQGSVSSVYGRQAISDKVHAAIFGKDQVSRLRLLGSFFGSELDTLERLLALRHLVASCEDTRRPSDDDDEIDSFDMSTAYSILCANMWKVKDLRQFSLISEIMELMLRTKPRSMSQWNIDSTLGSITILCSRNGPAVRATRAGTIYLHLCRLLQAVLTSHRIKLQGHFHLVVQVMQTLLRCLFVPLPHSTTKTTKFMAPPPWLSSPKHQLSAKHAVAFTRLVTLICDPSVSSVTRSQHNNLTSATNKAKGMAAQHMQLLLTTYIKLQLEMRMLPEIREKMIPGLYAIFDITSPEMRRMVNESLDSSGRSVFGTLFRDYQRFGKWKG